MAEETKSGIESPEKHEYLAFVRHCIETNIVSTIKSHRRYEEFLADPEVLAIGQAVLAEKMKGGDFAIAKSLIASFRIEQPDVEKIFLEYFILHAPIKESSKNTTYEGMVPNLLTFAY
ncbi:MAG: hypothetical protein A2749_01650 [Parcubacteria group bacterium RIFCSPHIGHO2_01_FULL_45_26]|nr:MAG: hypothetical protein A2749_01650 [Parcubacteria group bacterium RIFCSPHIGHO2_01_FULL_45_26]